MVPAGTAVWNSTLRITKGISLIGQTSTDPVTKRADDQTIISVATGRKREPGVDGDWYGKWQILSDQRNHLSHGKNGVMDGNGMIRLNGDSHAVRVDHCHFDDLAYEAIGIAVWGPIYGVIDHNLFDYRTTS